MAIRLGKYNTFLSGLQKALEGRRISESSELTTMDEQRLSLVPTAPVSKNKTNHVKQFNKIAKNKKSTELTKFETEYAAFIANLKAEQNKQPVITEPVKEPIISVIEQPNESIVKTVDEATNIDAVETVADTAIDMTEAINSEEVPAVVVEDLQQDAPVKTRKKKTKVVDNTVVEEKPTLEEPTMPDFMFD